MAGLAKATPELTVTHTQMLLAVPMEALCASPATTINPQYSYNVPMGTITDENLFSFFIFLFTPEDQDANPMVHFRDTNASGEIVLPRAVEHNQLTVFGNNLTGQLFRFQLLTLEEDLTIELQVSHISPIVSVDMIEIGRAGEVAVAGEIAGNPFLHYPVNLPPNELVMIDKLNVSFLTMLFLDETVAVLSEITKVL